jgi:hypothetical protein
VNLVVLVWLGCKGLLDNKALLVLQVLRVIEEIVAPLVVMVLMDKMDLKDRKEVKENLEQTVIKETEEILVWLDHKEDKDLLV